MATQALRCIKVQGWLERYGSPSERVVAGNGRAKLLRNNRVVAEAFRQHGGDWVIRLRDNSSATISVQGLPENVQRRIVLAALGAL